MMVAISERSASEKPARVSSSKEPVSTTIVDAPLTYIVNDRIENSSDPWECYGAKTASSKAKVKAQVPPWFGQDEAERNALTRHYSLPSSIAGKLISSPRVHKVVRSNGKEGIKIDISPCLPQEMLQIATGVPPNTSARTAHHRKYSMKRLGRLWLKPDYLFEVEFNLALVSL